MDSGTMADSDTPQRELIGDPGLLPERCSLSDSRQTDRREGEPTRAPQRPHVPRGVSRDILSLRSRAQSICPVDVLSLEATARPKHRQRPTQLPRGLSPLLCAQSTGDWGCRAQGRDLAPELGSLPSRISSPHRLQRRKSTEGGIIV